MNQNTKKAEEAQRLWSIDLFRGIAVLQMVLWQIFDFLGKVNIYDDQPFYIPYLNMPVNGPGLAWFAFIAGTGLYISIRRREERGQTRKAIASHILKRYGSLILLSFLFTAYMGSICTFFGWGEALQGIGLGALIVFVILAFVRSDKKIIVLILVIAFGQQLIRNNLLPKLDGFPGCPVGDNPIFQVLNNITFAGLFGFTHVVPIMLAGALLGMILERQKYASAGQQALKYGMLAFLGGIIIGTLAFGISFYGRSAPYILFIIGSSFLLFYIVEKLAHYRFLLKPIETYGQAAVVIYILHFAAIYRPAQLLGVADSLPNFEAAIASIFLTVLLYFIAILWLRYKNRLHL